MGAELAGRLGWYQALVRSLLEGEPSISRAAITFQRRVAVRPAPARSSSRPRGESRILLQDLSSSAHHLANATLETEWFHGLQQWRTHLHRQRLQSGATGPGAIAGGAGTGWRGQRAMSSGPPYLECENGSYKPGWLDALSPLLSGLQPNLVPEFQVGRGKKIKGKTFLPVSRVAVSVEKEPWL